MSSQLCHDISFSISMQLRIVFGVVLMSIVLIQLVRVKSRRQKSLHTQSLDSANMSCCDSFSSVMRIFINAVHSQSSFWKVVMTGAFVNASICIFNPLFQYKYGYYQTQTNQSLCDTSSLYMPNSAMMIYCLLNNFNVVNLYSQSVFGYFSSLLVAYLAALNRNPELPGSLVIAFRVLFVALLGFTVGAEVLSYIYNTEIHDYYYFILAGSCGLVTVYATYAAIYIFHALRNGEDLSQATVKNERLLPLRSPSLIPRCDTTSIQLVTRSWRFIGIFCMFFVVSAFGITALILEALKYHNIVSWDFSPFKMDFLYDFSIAVFAATQLIFIYIVWLW